MDDYGLSSSYKALSWQCFIQKSSKYLWTDSLSLELLLSTSGKWYNDIAQDNEMRVGVFLSLT